MGKLASKSQNAQCSRPPSLRIPQSTETLASLSRICPHARRHSVGWSLRKRMRASRSIYIETLIHSEVFFFSKCEMQSNERRRNKAARELSQQRATRAEQQWRCSIGSCIDR